MRRVKSRAFVLGLIGAVAVLLWEFRGYRRYPLGMTISEATALMGKEFPAQQFGIDYDTSGPSASERANDAFYYIYDRDSGMMLLFNYNKVLIDRHKISWFGVNIPELVDKARH